jgi:uncharacterized metal-binding protein YceD (DUF177 family)
VTPPEFSRLVPLARLGSEPVRESITAGAAEREALARRFGLLALDHLSATLELRRETGGVITLAATYEAAFVQSCVVSLEPVAGKLSECFSLRYGRSDEETQAISLDPEGEAFEPLAGEAIDVGEAVAQELSLALPAFPRHPDAVLEESASAPTITPFAALEKLSRNGQP